MGDGDTTPASNTLPDVVKDIQNILGLLIAAFGGVLSFLGLGSAEVTAVLRNDAKTATIVALFLLLSVLAAIAVIPIPDSLKITPLSAIGVLLLLLSADDFAIYNIPVYNASTSGHIATPTWGFVLLGLGLAAVVAGALLDKDHISGFGDGLIRVEFVLIMASIVFLGTSMYGALRAEAASQGQSSIQVSATAATGATTTVTVQVTAARVMADHYVSVHASVLTNADAGKCSESDAKSCAESDVFDGTFPPDPDGSVAETIQAIPIDSPGSGSQVVVVTASVCQEQSAKTASGAQATTDDCSGQVSQEELRLGG
jgi:hypothetical protein